MVLIQLFDDSLEVSEEHVEGEMETNRHLAIH